MSEGTKGPFEVQPHSSRGWRVWREVTPWSVDKKRVTGLQSDTESMESKKKTVTLL